MGLRLPILGGLSPTQLRLREYKNFFKKWLRRTCDDGVVELVQFVLQCVDEPAHRQQPDDEHGQDEEHAHRPRLDVTFFEFYVLHESVAVPEPTAERDNG